MITASAGNHAQGVAYHATQRGIRALIVMPLTTPLVKVTATRDFGAEVLLHGANYDESFAEAMRLCAKRQLTFIHPFDDAGVMAGQGTIGLELLEQVPRLGGCRGADRRRRADRRRCLRHQGNATRGFA